MSANSIEFNEKAFRGSPVILQHLKWFRFFGATPLTISMESMSRLSKPYLAWSVIILVLTAFGWFWETMVCFRKTGSYAVMMFDAHRKSLGVFLMTFILYLNIRNRFKYEKTIRRLMTLQRMLRTSTYSMFTSLKVLIVLWAPCLIARSFLYQGVAQNTTGATDLGLLVWNLQYMYYMSVCSHFMYLANCIAGCFFALSTTINDSDVNRFIKIHTQLCDIAADINGYYDFFISTILFGTLLGGIYFTAVIYEAQDLGFTRVTVIMLLTLSMTTFATAAIIHTSQSTSDKADLCNSVLLESLINHTSINSTHSLGPLPLMHLTLRNSVTFKYLKIVPINYNLGTTMLTAYISYTIVYFQINFAKDFKEKVSQPSNASIIRGIHECLRNVTQSEHD